MNQSTVPPLWAVYYLVTFALAYFVLATIPALLVVAAGLCLGTTLLLRYFTRSHCPRGIGRA